MKAGDRVVLREEVSTDRSAFGQQVWPAGRTGTVVRYSAPDDAAYVFFDGEDRGVLVSVHVLDVLPRAAMKPGDRVVVRVATESIRAAWVEHPDPPFAHLWIVGRTGTVVAPPRSESHYPHVRFDGEEYDVRFPPYHLTVLSR